MKAEVIAGLVLAWSVAAQPTSVTLPPFTREVLPNGVVLCLMPKDDAALVSVRAVVRGGAESDPPGRAGLSSVVANLLTRGTRTHPADEFAAEIDFLGANIESHVDAQSSTLALDVLPENAAAAIALFVDGLLRPAFADEEVRRQLARSIEWARSRKDSPEDALWQYFRSFFFLPPHPYGRPFGGDELTLASIGGAAVREHHARMVVGRNLIVTAVGPFAEPRLRGVLANAFGSFARGERYEWKRLPPATPSRSARLLLIDKRDATQTQFVIGFPGIRRTHPDRLPLRLVNNILGGRFTSLLNERLRVESGLTYEAYSYIEQDRLNGAIAVHSYTATADTKRALDLALAVLGRFAKTGVTADQLAAARTYIEAGYPPDHLQTADQLADLLGELELYGLGRDEIDGLFARLDAVTLDRANRVLKRYYTGAAPVLVLIGRADRVRPQVRCYADLMMEASIAQPGFPQLTGPAGTQSKTRTEP